MKTEPDKQGLSSFTPEQLKGLYHQINSQLAKNLLSGKGIEAEKDRIEMLNKIAEELNRRSFTTKVA